MSSRSGLKIRLSGVGLIMGLDIFSEIQKENGGFRASFIEPGGDMCLHQSRSQVSLGPVRRRFQVGLAGVSGVLAAVIYKRSCQAKFMKNSALLLWILTMWLVAACRAVGVQGEEISGPRASELVRRNLFAGQEHFPIEAARAYQYGSVHVDGPDGGMLYRFGSNGEALDWLVAQHRLLETPITSPSQLPLGFLDQQPRWWDPWQANPGAYYMIAEELDTGGERQLIVVFDAAARVLFVVEHYLNMPGV